MHEDRRLDNKANMKSFAYIVNEPTDGVDVYPGGKITEVEYLVLDESIKGHEEEIQRGWQAKVEAARKRLTNEGSQTDCE